MKKIALIVALDTERDALLAVLEGLQEECAADGQVFYVGRLGGASVEVIVAQSGIGKVNAAMCAASLIDRFHPDAVINTGVAGGCGPRVRPLDVVVARQCVYHDVWCGEPNLYGQVQGCPLYFPAAPQLLDRAVALGARPVLICTGDIFAQKDDVARILQKFPECEAVDMESASFAQVCYRRNIPFLSLRVISDSADGEENFGQYENFWEMAPRATFRVVRSLLEGLSA